MVAKMNFLVFGMLLMTAHASPNASSSDMEEMEPATPKFLAARSSASQDSSVTGSVQAVDMTSEAMEAALSDLMSGKSAFGATPMGGSVKKIEDLLTKTMMPKVKAAHRTDQATLYRLIAEVKKCGSTKDAALKVAKPSNDKYVKNSKFHQGCRGDEAVKYSSKTSCLAQQRADYNNKKLKCDYFATVGRNYGTTKANVAVVKKAGSEKTEDYIRRISSTICGRHIHGSKGEKSGKGGWGGGLPGSMLDKYLRAKDACEQATKKYAARVIECKRKAKEYIEKRAKCNQYQGLMDAASCKNAVLTKDACEAYAGCYHAKVQAYRIAEKNVRSEEVDRKAEWRGLERMHCLIKAFADGKVTNAEVDKCKRSSWKPVSTKLLNIKYPRVPPLVKCNLPNLFPATGAYKKKEFKPLPVLAKGVASAACSGMVSIPTTPRTGSPKGAVCKRIALNGYYSPGALVKCTGGHDVRRSNDKNSCPLGTKIFAPATRSDWRTFLASAKPLRNPHWIIDVTRPANSCGGCRSHPMNSKNKQQKTWQTSDGAPWWLRSTRYNEPNGDYHANCYLDLWATPKDENHVTWNDGNCNYHSRSYYCQPVSLSLKPQDGSPKSCKCTKVDLAGTYTAGSLIKCEQCITVYRSTQKNSCPNGMKIFSPASRRDWKTFLDSAGPLRAPHWIIDVTRPQNGCGGCKNYAMKGTTPQQATWKTSDGSPWWLRSTKYNEPNGDYTGNCFLYLHGHPHSADVLQFNDHNCHYHSRSYYCQPKKSDHLYAWRGREPQKLLKKVRGNCASSKNTGVGSCYAPSGKTKKQRAKEACESVYGKDQCSTQACGTCNDRGYHAKSAGKACNGATMWNFHDQSAKLNCGWAKCEEVIISSDGGKSWKSSCKSGKYDLRPANKKPLCRSDACIPKKFDLGHLGGVRHNLKIASLTSAGWQTWSNVQYAHHTTPANIQPNRGDCILWGSKVNNHATTLHVAALGRRSKINGKSGPVQENGVWWYTRHGKSNGFAPNSQIRLGSADTSDSGGAGNRLSWHLHKGGHVGGWRSGAKKWLNGDRTWRKVVMYGPCKAGR